MKKTYNEKLNEKNDLPKTVNLIDKPGFVERYKTTTMYIASPLEYNEIMKRVPKGKVITGDRIRAYLSSENNAGTTCSLTAGIFMNICAHAADERDDKLFPWWRTIKTNGELNEKYPGGISNQMKHLEEEGFKVTNKLSKYFVIDYIDKLWDINK